MNVLRIDDPGVIMDKRKVSKIRNGEERRFFFFFSIIQEYFRAKGEEDMEETDMRGHNVAKMPSIWEDAISWSNSILSLT